MANKVIKGLTVEISGDTTKLGQALDSADKQSRALSGELRQIDKLLQFDSANPELLAQKQKVLSDQITQTADKLALLKTAQEQAAEAFKRGEVSEEQMRALEREVISAENALKKYQTAADDTAQKISDVGANTAETAEAVKPLTETVKAQEAELSKLKADYVNVAAAQGADSEEAKKLLSTIGNLSAELVDNKQKMQAAKQTADQYDSTVAKNATTTLSLTETVKAQEKELSALKEKYVDTAAAKGKDSAEAQNLAAKITALSAELKVNEAAYSDAMREAEALGKSDKTLSETVADQQNELKKLRAEYVEIVAVQGADSDEAKRLAGQITALSDDLKENEKTLKSAEQAAESLGKEEKSLSEITADQKRELSALKEKYADTAAAKGKDSAEAKTLARQIEALSGELSENEKQLGQAKNEADKFDKTVDDLGDSSKDTKIDLSGLTNALKSGVSAACSAAAEAIGAAISKLTSLGESAISVGKQFDSSMSKVAAVSGATGDDLDALRDKAKEMGAATQFSASEAADAMNYMAMAGWKTEDMLNGVEGIMNLAAASGEDLATTSDIVTDALTALGMTAADSAHFADILAATSSNANTNVSMMGESFKYVAPIAGSMGASAEDLSIALGLMANSGIKGSQAGNSLKNALVNLTKPTKQQAAAMQELGFISTETIQKIDFAKVEKAEQAVEDATISLDNAQVKLNDAISKYGEGSSQAQLASNNYEKAQLKLARAQETLTKEQEGVSKEIAGANTLMTDADGNMRSLGDIMGILREKMGKVNVELTDADGNAREFDDIIAGLSTTTEGLAQAEQMQAAAAIFGKQNMAGMLAIINASEEDYNKLTQAVYSSGYSIDAVNKSLKESGIAWEKYGDQAWTADGAIENLASEIIYNVNQIGTSTEDLRDYLESEYDLNADDALMAIEAVTAAMESSKGAAKSMASTMQDNLEGDMKALGSKAEALGITVYESMNAPLRELAQLGGTFISEITSAFEEGGFDKAAYALGDVLGQAITKLTSYLPKVAKIGVSVISSLVKGIKEQLPVLLRAASSCIETLAQSLVEIAPDLLETGGEILMALVDGVIENIDQVLDAAILVIQKLADGLIQNLPKIVNAAITLVVKLADAITENIDMIVNAAVMLITTLAASLLSKDNLSKIIHAAIDLILALAKALTNPDTLFALVDAIPEIIGAIVDALVENAGDLIIGAFEIITALVTGLFKKENLDKLFDAGKNILDKIWEGIKSLFTNLLDWFANIGTEIGYKVAEWVEDAKQWGMDLIQNFIDGCKEVWNKWEGFWEDVGETIFDYLHHSTPEKGPLKDDDKWGADFMENFIDSAAGKEDELVKTVDDIADSISDAMRIDAPEIEVPEFDLPDYPDTPVKIPLTIEPELDGIDTEFSFDGVQRSLHMNGEQTVIMAVDPEMMEKLDQILGAIEDGKDILLDGDKLVGGTADRYNSAFGEMQVLSERSVQ